MRRRTRARRPERAPGRNRGAHPHPWNSRRAVPQGDPRVARARRAHCVAGDTPAWRAPDRDAGGAAPSGGSLARSSPASWSVGASGSPRPPGGDAGDRPRAACAIRLPLHRGRSRRAPRWSRQALVAGDMGGGGEAYSAGLAASVELMREVARQRALAQWTSGELYRAPRSAPARRCATTSAGRSAPTTTRSAPARWARTQTPWSTPSYGSTAWRACGSPTRRSCRHHDREHERSDVHGRREGMRSVARRAGPGGRDGRRPSPSSAPPAPTRPLANSPVFGDTDAEGRSR
jgi:hypothetical protein